MITTAAAILGAAAIGGVASAVGASKASKAANTAADLQAKAAADNNALQEKIYNQTRTDNMPFHDVGVSAVGALANQFGLPHAPSMTGAASPTYASTPVPGYGGVSMTSPGGAPVATNAAPAVAPAQSGVDWNAYLQQNPDVLANAQQRVAAGTAASIQAVAEEHYNDYGKAENRALPMNPSTGSAAGAPNAPAPGYNDPTAPNGYSVGARPDPGAGPGAYVAPARMTGPALDVSAGAFHTDPGYNFAVSEAQRAINNQASGLGRVMSGQRLKALNDRAVGMADQQYQDWRNYTTGQYNLDRSRGDTIYSEDRGFGYGQARDARGDFVQDRGRTDGLYADDRAFTTGRYDTRNNQLMTLAGFGTSTNNANSNAGQTFAQATGANNMTAANAAGDAKIAGANAFNSGVNNLMTTGAYLAGNYLSGGFSGSSLPKQYNI